MCNLNDDRWTFTWKLEDVANFPNGSREVKFTYVARGHLSI